MTDGELRYCLDNPFDVGFFAIRRSEFQIAARLAANARHDVVSAVFLNRRAGERTLTLGLTFSSDQQEEVFAGIGEIEPNGRQAPRTSPALPEQETRQLAEASRPQSSR
jgi:hypothetical protein